MIRDKSAPRITERELRDVAHLARIPVREEEVAPFATMLNQVLERVYGPLEGMRAFEKRVRIT